MISVLAVVAASAGVMALFLADRSRKTPTSAALWIPFAWLAILASRPVAFWFSPVQQVYELANGQSDNPIDRNILIALMLMGSIVLALRRLPWASWIRANQWVVLFIVYCGVSTLWADEPGVPLKRWVRAVGALLMILIVASERDPIGAMRVLLRRCAFLLVPMSVVLIKYVRSLGVTHGYWNGEEILIGVTTNKNALGRLCLISGVFFLWDLIMTRKYDQLAPGSKATHQLIGSGMLTLTFWLLLKSGSSTSLASFILGSAIVLVLGLAPFKKSGWLLEASVVTTALLVVGLDQMFGLLEMTVVSLGRDMTFTDRTFVWRDLLALDTNPIFGLGYDSLFLGQRLEMFVQKHGVAEAHNGFLEVYLELGAVGLFLLTGLIASALLRSKQSLINTHTADYGRLQLAMLGIFLVYNITEAAYKATTLMAFTFLLVLVQRPGPELTPGPVDSVEIGSVRVLRRVQSRLVPARGD